MSKHHIVVSAENNPYMEWQCKLFYYSCVTRLQQQPLIIVHDSGNPLGPGFYDLVKAGCAIYPAPSYRTTAKGLDYLGRNHPGSLIEASKRFANDDGFIVLCDSDLIFLRKVEFPHAPAAEYSYFMEYQSPCVIHAMNALGIQQEAVMSQAESLQCSVPYVIPIAAARGLGEAWLQAIDVFPELHWEDIMYAFGLALVKLGLKLEITHTAQTNHRPDDQATMPIIHYAYGDDRWNKRNYSGEQAGAVWETRVETTAGTIIDELQNQIREARDFYRDPYAQKPMA